MFTAVAFGVTMLLAWYGGRKNDQDRPTYDRALPDERIWLLVLHIRQDLKLVAFFLGGVIIMLGVIARIEYSASPAKIQTETLPTEDRVRSRLGSLRGVRAAAVFATPSAHRGADCGFRRSRPGIPIEGGHHSNRRRAVLARRHVHGVTALVRRQDRIVWLRSFACCLLST